MAKTDVNNMLLADEYGGDGCDWTVELAYGSYGDCEKELDRQCKACAIQYHNYRIVNERAINGIC